MQLVAKKNNEFFRAISLENDTDIDKYKESMLQDQGELTFVTMTDEEFEQWRYSHLT